MKRRIKVASGLALLAIGAVVFFIPPARASMEALMSCAQSTACLEWDNTKGGDAIKGVSSKGDALHGQTKFNSTGKTAGKAGVFGEDLSASGTLNAGVLGASTNGAGVLGTSTSYNAVEGLSTNSTGVYGQTVAAGGFGVAGRNTSASHDNNGAGVLADGGSADDGLHAFANGANANGVYAFSQTGSALVANNGSTDENPELSLNDTGHVLNDAILVQGASGAVFHVLNSGDAGLTGRLVTGSLSTGAITAGPITSGAISSGQLAPYDANGAAVYSQSQNGNAAWLISYDNSSYPTVYVQGGGASNEVGVFEVGIGGFAQMSVTNYGNVDIRGLLYSSGSCHNGCVTGQKQTRAVAAYAPAEAEPTIEDTGEAALVDGIAHVQVDPKFANVIDTKSDYVVLVTPEGDCRGLYVTNRTPISFDVRELGGGRASIGFAYRIVAKRFGISAARLPMTDIRPVAMPPRPRPVRRLKAGS